MTHNIAHNDTDYMAMAIALSWRARGNSGLNPNVGCVIVKEGHIIGRGWTQQNGRPHAEAIALAMAGDRAENADIYTTLEPCYHQSERGPDCASSIIAAKPKRLIYALQDPDPRTNGKGIERIKSAGIRVTKDIGADNAHHAMAGFFMQQQNSRPHISLKLAISMDGCIALQNGNSQWITGDIARAHTHLVRAHHDAILVGTGTVKTDNPRLNVRLESLKERSPIRYQLGSSDAPDGWESIKTLDDVRCLAHNMVMVEGGAITAASFLRADLVDQIYLYRAPIILGGKSVIGDMGLESLSAAHDKWRMIREMQLGKDRLEIYERTR